MINESLEETALLRRRPMAFRWDPMRWTIGVAWQRHIAQLSVYPIPCVAVDVHLPGRRTRTGVARWLRAHVISLLIYVAILLAMAIGFFAGRIFPGTSAEIPTGHPSPTTSSSVARPAVSSPAATIALSATASAQEEIAVTASPLPSSSSSVRRAASARSVCTTRSCDE